MPRPVKLTGPAGTGPVWVWPAHVMSMHSDGQRTLIVMAGATYSLLVLESVDQVLEMMDGAAAGLLA